MAESTRSFLFPDVNVWLALSYERHIHHPSAHRWFEQLNAEVQVCFCRFTQLGLLRLLTTAAVMGEDGVVSQKEAWEVYDRWLEDDRVLFIDEPPFIEVLFRGNSVQTKSAPKDWADSYLLAFASTADLRLVTFDRGLNQRSARILLLE